VLSHSALKGQETICQPGWDKTYNKSHSDITGLYPPAAFDSDDVDAAKGT